jgi:hypothetical protein
MGLEIIDCQQGTPEWFSARAGLITCSEFSQLLAKGAGLTRKTLMLKKAGERITGNPAESYSNGHMERGKEQEGTARELYEAYKGVEIVECGFMKNDNVGYSPDGLIAENGLVEIKSRLAHIQAETLLSDKIPSENIAQIQGGLWISGREYLDYVSYCPNMPLFIKRVYPDLDYVTNLKIEIVLFEKQLQDMVEQILRKFDV